MALLLDTQIIVWFGADDRRLSAAAKAAIVDDGSDVFISAVVAMEFEDLRIRGRFGVVPALDSLLRNLDATVLDFPAAAYTLLALLPQLHRDPVDRMLIAHAIHGDLTLVTADAQLRRYPVRTLW